MTRERNRQAPAARPPLDAERLQELALNYAARYAASGARLRRYLARKLRERGWAEEEGEPDLDALIARFERHGYIDDAAFAQMRTRDLVRRGYGARRVAQTLHQDGIGEADRQQAAPDAATLRRAAVQLAAKRRFGPFAPDHVERERREKHLAAMIRAGHDFETARVVLDAGSEAELAAWIAEAED